MSFEVGEYIFLCISPKWGVLCFVQDKKLSPYFIGPFEILKCIGKVAYRLALPPQLSNVHNIFHMSMLRKYELDTSHVLDWSELPVKEDVSYIEQLIQILEESEHVLQGRMISLV